MSFVTFFFTNGWHFAGLCIVLVFAHDMLAVVANALARRARDKAQLKDGAS